MIGTRSGKVLGAGCKSKCCRICQHSASNSTTPPSHDCRKNWTGSAKSMESAIVIDILKDLKDNDKDVGKIIGDDDTTTIARARAEIDPNIEKGIDKNHVRKNVSNSLYELKKRHKSLSTTVINSLIKNFNYAITQNHGDPETLEKALSACYLHPFGDHTHCGDWCRHHLDADNYKHRNLPYGKDLQDENLKKDLKKLFSGYIDQKEKLSSLGSSQANESFNHTVASKAPKTKHYSSSESLSYRLHQSVLQKNEGYSYLPMVHHSVKVPPII